MQLQHYHEVAFTDTTSQGCTNLQSLTKCLDREVSITQHAVKLHRGRFKGSAEGQGASASLHWLLKPCHQMLVKHLLEPAECICHRTLRTFSGAL